MTGSPHRRNRWLFALALFCFAPFVGEFLYGNTAITSAPWAIMIAPMYGGGAVLVREIGRRTGGWPTMLLLGAAYALTEEGPIDQMLFNPGYLGLDSFAGFAPIPGLDISAGLTVSSLVLHTSWSICVPIAIIEAFDRNAGTGDRPPPWLGRIGLAVVAVVFVLGSTGLALTQHDKFRFVGTPAQFAATGAVILGLITLGLFAHRPAGIAIPGRSVREHGADGDPGPNRSAPDPSRVAVTSFVSASGYWLIDVIGPWVTDPVPAGDWDLIAAKTLLVASIAIGLIRWSHRDGWHRKHRFAVAGGALATYIWVGFVHAQSMGFGVTIALLGNITCTVATVVVLWWAARSERGAAADPSNVPDPDASHSPIPIPPTRT